jgi:glycosyltransferase involved in cell wall biosynthesis
MRRKANGMGPLVMEIESAAPVVSVIIITHNRSHTLVATFESFRHIVEYPKHRLEFVLVDDASSPAHAKVAALLPCDRRIYNQRNLGLGASINLGIRAAVGKYVLLLQDDWLLTGRPTVIAEAVQVLESAPEVGIVHLRDWGAREYQTSEVREIGGVTVEVLSKRSDDGSILRTYSDNPHLKRRNVHEVVGWYRENVPMTIMENAMNEAVSRQQIFQCVRLKGPLPFVHIGENYSFNPSGKRARLEAGLKETPLGRGLLRIVRYSRGAVRRFTVEGPPK